MSRARVARAVASVGVLSLLAVAWSTSHADHAAPDRDRPVPVSLPTGRGLPVLVRTGVQFVDVGTIDENAGTFDATIDLRLRWSDPSLAATTLDVRGDAATDALAAMWFPDIELGNLVDEPRYRERGLRVERGEVELLERTQGTFSAPFDAHTFPFDRHRLDVEVVVRGAVSDEVALDFRKADVEFSRAAGDLALAEWEPTLVDLEREPLAGWRDTVHSRVMAGLWVERRWESAVAPVFIPLFASLLIPLLSVWLQKCEEGEFEVDAFELTNIVIGGLFAVIALNFTINAEYVTLASGDNTVSRLFALNYATLAFAFVNNILVFQLGLPARWFGRHVQQEVFRFTFWALPVIVLGTAAAFVLAAAAS